MTATSAEALMRSRYVAYVRGREPYLLSTWHPSTRPATLDLAREPQPNWLGLMVMRSESLGPDKALVEFTARYKVNGRAHRLHEVSRFVLEDGHWFYVDGDIVDQ